MALPAGLRAIRRVITHAWSRALQERGAYASWLDVWVTLTAPPTSALTGILGRTFRAGAISAASAAPLVAGLASEP